MHAQVAAQCRSPSLAACNCFFMGVAVVLHRTSFGSREAVPEKEKHGRQRLPKKLQTAEEAGKDLWDFATICKGPVL